MFKTTSPYLFLLFVLMVLGCKQEKVEFENQLILKLSLVIHEDDEFQLFYNSAESTGFTSDNSITHKIKGKDTIQSLFFVLKDDEYPNRLRIDFGNNRNQKQVEVKEIKLSYNEAFKSFSKDEIKVFFKSNEYFDFDFETLMGKGVVINNSYDPYLESMNLSTFINELILY